MEISRSNNAETDQKVIFSNIAFISFYADCILKIFVVHAWNNIPLHWICSTSLVD